MKNFDFLPIALVLLLVCIIVKYKLDHKAEVAAGYDFEECYTSDYDDMLKKFGEDGFEFYWCQAKMDRPIDDRLFKDSANITEVVTFFQLKDEDVCIQYTHPEGRYDDKTPVIDTIEGVWMECADIRPEDVDMTLDQAIECLSQTESDMPGGKYIVMRCPLTPPFYEKACWFFGDEDEYVALDPDGGLYWTSGEYAQEVVGGF